ncbi:patatin-like phospholipase family protein [Pseudogemmobacter sp. W21_MBD1_M6]|uniref:patatin-like phospholipase family protein n=1 Tax=Pseudogemmobacter sp. W21_MBD1_M6 TaxID=3240271 RepID=UPI003F991613
MVKRINLALQGGGAHGAFTWGVLDRLLDDDDIEIGAISGTSAGALNGAALKAGMVKGGRVAAKENLAWLWGQMGAVSDMRMSGWMALFGPGPAMAAQMMERAGPFSIADTVSTVMSPYSFGPAYRNPLAKIAERFEFEHVCAAGGPALFVSATNVRSGKIRVFSGAEISADVLLATTCLPTVFQAVEFMDPATGKIEAFWDGGYSGNPALFPLFEPQFSDDLVIVNINPLVRNEVPTTPAEIQNRVNEISFNSSLLRELRAINFVKRLLGAGALRAGTMKDVLVHMIADDALMNELSATTKMTPNPYLLHRLREAGYAAAERFLQHHRDDLGRNGTVDLAAAFN